MGMFDNLLRHYARTILFHSLFLSDILKRYVIIIIFIINNLVFFFEDKINRRSNSLDIVFQICRVLKIPRMLKFHDFVTGYPQRTLYRSGAF